MHAPPQQSPPTVWNVKAFSPDVQTVEQWVHEQFGDQMLDAIQGVFSNNNQPVSTQSEAVGRQVRDDEDEMVVVLKGRSLLK